MRGPDDIIDEDELCVAEEELGNANEALAEIGDDEEEEEVAAANGDEDVQELEEEEEEEEAADEVEHDAEDKASPKRKKVLATYSYPFPEGATTIPPFVTHASYVAAMRALSEAGPTKKQQAAVSVSCGLNFASCIADRLPYFDMKRGFAMDALHDILLGPVKAALEHMFGRGKLSDTSGYNSKLPLRLPGAIGGYISTKYVALQKYTPTEKSLRLRSPHRLHQFFKGAFMRACARFCNAINRC